MTTLNAHRIITLDNNVYRDLTLLATKHQLPPEELVTRIRAEEQAAGIQALASPVVVTELVTHLTGRDLEAYLRARDALICLAHHCSAQIDGEEKVATLSGLAPISWTLG